MHVPRALHLKERTMRPRSPDYLGGHYYQFYNRGAHREPIFREEDNYLFVLRRMKHYARTLALTPIAYCLMPNHYHFLIRQEGEQAAGLLPQRVFNSYTKAYNRRYGRSGTLFEGPYKVVAVEEEPYLLHLCRYIHANPVKDGLVDGLGDWPYSNYLEWVDLRPGTLVDREFVRVRFPVAQGYADFVSEYVAGRRLPEELQAYLGRWDARR
jgi:putative transposase